jgi:hypothetical protein
MCESFINTIARLRRDLRSSRSENRRLEELFDERKARESLECPVCLEEKEKWLSVQCGHLFCYECVLDLMKRETFFNKPCPLCQERITSLAVCYSHSRNRLDQQTVMTLSLPHRQDLSLRRLWSRPLLTKGCCKLLVV